MNEAFGKSDFCLKKDEFLWLKDYIYNKTGIVLNENKVCFVNRKLSLVLNKHKCKSFNELIDKLKKMFSEEQIHNDIIESILVNETFFFRDDSQFKYLKDTLLKSFIDKYKKGVKVKIWSAACSTGQEPYSIAITIREFIKNFNKINIWKISEDNFEIIASDISSRVIKNAENGIYNDFEKKRGITEEYNKYFEYYKNIGWKISDDIRRMVKYSVINLISESDLKKIPNDFDIIFCRNIFIYFDDIKRNQIFKLLYKKLNKDNDSKIFLGCGEYIGFLDSDKLFSVVRNKSSSEIVAKVYQLNKSI